MKSICLQAGSILALASLVLAQTPTGVLGAITTLACYKDVSPLKELGDWPFMTDGWCQGKCGGQSNEVMAIVGGSTCYCGDVIPSLDKTVDESHCNSPCQGFGDKTCGGIGYFQVYLTGLTGNVKTAANGTDTPGDDEAASSSPAVVTKPGETVVVTQSPSSSSNSGGGPNKVGIAVGVVVAIVVVASAIGAAVFFLKQRKKRAIEEEHRRNAAIAEFTKKSDTSSMTDSRLDHSFLSSHRRESIGSIADEMDFTRRILQVRNPDHRASNASNFA